ncbi:MAG: COR domain-containing protein, partial [Sedimentisphaerales bacterium]|nr:COR domain-containing protein [Sedimentisphaerales bacterium]
LKGNQLTSVPKELGQLTNLTRLVLKGNQLKVGAEIYDLPPQEQIQEILKWQRAQKAGTLQPIHEAKVIFIGESDYGKTHLIEFLRKGKIKRKINTTHGIERSHITIPYKDKDIRLNIWDLGGQEFMRSTHQFFFSERTLYVLVTLARRERNELNHWLKLAKQLGNEAPVLVVINKIDKDPHDLDRKSLERDYPNIIGFVRTCIYDCEDSNAADTIELLKKKITATVCDMKIMPGVFEQRPPEWFTVKKELEKLEKDGKDFITYEEYENLEFIKDLPEEERKSNLKLLSMIGAVVSFVDDPRLVDTNVINPQWIMDGVYAIINDSKVKDETKGELHINDLERILAKKKFPKTRHAYLLELMKKFNLCYGARDQRDIFLIPDLFEDIEPDFEWDSSQSMHFRYNYDDFPPNVFMTRFIVEMHQDIQEEKRWRSGVFISNGSCRAKVYQTYRKNYIHVEVMGNKGEGRSYLYAIRDTFRKLHKPFSQMQIK